MFYCVVEPCAIPLKILVSIDSLEGAESTPYMTFNVHHIVLSTVLNYLKVQCVVFGGEVADYNQLNTPRLAPPFREATVTSKNSRPIYLGIPCILYILAICIARIL